MAASHAPHYDALIIGAGIAGCALARALALQGRTVLIVDRNLAAPDRIVGELLQPGGVEGLKQLGLGECLEGIEATPVKGYHLYWKDEETSFWFCPTVVTNANGKRETRTHTGCSFHHGRLVAKLRDAIRGDLTITMLEATAHEILRDAATGRTIGVGCSVNRGNTHKKYYADLIVLADGPNSNFRSQFTRYRPQSQSRFWGLELTGVHLPIRQYAYGILGSGPPLLVYQIGNETTRVLIDVFNDTYDGLGNQEAVRRHIVERVLPTVPTHLQRGLADALTRGRLRSMPNSWMSATRNRTPGLLLLGDSANMRHPMTGAGMTVAIKDAILLSRLLTPKTVPSFADADLVLKKLNKFHWKRKYHSASLNVLAQTLYLLFASEARTITIMQRGFITFVQGGENNFGGAVALMGGMIDRPFLLITYFVRIAFFSVWLHLKSVSVMELPVAMADAICMLYNATLILLPAVIDELGS